MTGKDCAYCSSFQELNNGEPTIDEVHELFHQPCSSCSSLSSSAEFICYSCQHLRLRHLMVCMRIETCKKFMFPLRKGLVVKDDTATQCPLCRVAERIILRAFDPAQYSHLERTRSTLMFDLKQSRQKELGQSSISLAEVYAYYNNGNATSFDWVVDLHISNMNKVANFPYVREMVSWTHLKDKMSECYEGHKECQYNAKEGLPKGFRVIDVIRRVIVEMSDCSFVALSYVWGLDTRPSLLTATCATIAEMKKDGGLPASEMPQTIEDAMSVCAQLGERYLWADRLCIIQDDAEDKRNQINAMNEIYSLARLVLIVAYGDTMDFGIPGIGHPREIVQHHEDVSGLRVTNVIREIEGDPLALWHTRGWTYQEAVLAKRRLYFTNVRAFFECEQSICHEDQCNPEKLRNEFTSHGLLIADDGSRFASFARHLKNYTSRSLTYPSDTYNAITGISKALYDTEGVFLNGLPQVDFDRALRWYADSGNNFTTPFENSGIVLPTWSWSSVMSLSDRVDYQATKLYGTLVPWHKSDASSPPALLKAFNTHIETIMDDDWELYMAIACSEGCVANLSFPLLLKSTNFSTEAIDLVSMTKNRQTSPLLSLKNGTFLEDLKSGIILTRAQIAFLRLAKTPQKSGFHIIDSRGESVGELCGDVIRLEKEVTSPQHDKKTLYEFMALSLSGKRITTYSGEERKTKNYFDTNGNSLAMLPIVNVLMIGWRDSYAYRQELGWIYLVDWAKARREWKVVLLE